MEPPKKKLTARDLERMKQYQDELEKEPQNGEEEEDKPVWSLAKAQTEASSRQCPYLDTIDRLDFM